MILTCYDKSPRIDPSTLVLPTAVVAGDVTIGPASSLWFQVVVRADVNFVRIGSRTNIQDGSVVHVTHGRHPTLIGSEVTVGHRVVLHGCTVEDRCLIGIGAVILDGAIVGEESMVAAGSVVAPGTRLPPRTLAMGTPARVRRELTAGEIAHLSQAAKNYVRYREDYLHLGQALRQERSG